MTSVYAAKRRRKTGSRARVEVRISRRGRALRVDGTFASWYTPGRDATGSVWDALAAPLLWLPRSRRRRVLILGLGGGSAARLVRAIAPEARIVGVERDPEVVRAARRWFDLEEIGIDVVEADARVHLARSRRSYDAVIEDIFVGSGRRVRKPDWLPDPGLALAARRVTPGGLLISNSIDEAARVARTLRDLFPGRVRICVDDYDNQIFAAGPAALRAADVRAGIRANPVLRDTLPRLRVRTLGAGR